MQMRIRCDCGDEIVSGDADDLVARARRHAATAHQMDISPERVLALAQPCEPAAEMPTGRDHQE